MSKKYKIKKLGKELLTGNELFISTAFGGFIFGILIFIFFMPNYYQQQSPVVFEVKQGETLSEIIHNLHEQEIIPSKINMHIAAFINDAGSKIKAGKYKIKNGLSYLELIEKLIEGTPEETVKITIPEGLWLKKIAGVLNSELKINSSRFLELCNNKSFIKSLGIDAENLNGYLLPETYYVVKDSDEEDIIRFLVSRTMELFDEEAKEELKKHGKTIHEILTLASIVEAETRIKEELPIVAGVYYNRLKRGMALQADPTIQFLLRNKNRRTKRVYYKDLEIDSPYNTYKYSGLPPGPINNPGKDAIMATIYPDSHNYFYFVANGDGGHDFAKNYSEHLRNVRDYKRWRRSQ